ncbi:MAG TPA: segregation/condensation protein A [Chitinophagales bacterium]|nr:segregation/condensation protein A [Chitinophagales bacterium]MCB9074490.1 segregation/condensation protein A [Chitinophagales bacterium]HMU98211.1 segregation/condensation protein A [Chitinophagales bacterium]HMV02338.1 segregation/condensation protein A [Chitinophagales bacterium]HMW94296.1 segregation/condensation protein A [Chitinophagales bacterium]
MSAPFLIHLPQFEGPFDLLLFFIERDELDIEDIPIFKITKDFLNYIHHLERLNIEVASEFMLVAASLMRIKAKMLLPRKELDEQGNEIDPRQELIQQLVEYKKIKEVVEEIKDLEAQRSLRHTRGNQKAEVEDLIKILADDVELETVSLIKLMRAYQRALDKYKTRTEKITHKIVQYEYTIEEERNKLASLIKEKKKSSFEEILTACENKMHAVFIFLGMLELIQQQVIFLVLGEGNNNFWLSSTRIDD